MNISNERGGLTMKKGAWKFSHISKEGKIIDTCENQGKRYLLFMFWGVIK